MIQEEARRLIESGKVKYIIGYERGSDCCRSTPAFIDKAEDTGRLIFDPTCINNLSVYLLDERDRLLAAEDSNRMRKRNDPIDRRPVAIVAKGCDSRSIMELVVEHIVPRNEVYVLGVPCTGMVDKEKVERALKKKGLGKELDNLSLKAEGSNFIVGSDGDRTSFKKEELIADKCSECRFPTPLLYDVLLGEKIEVKEESYEFVEEIEKMPLGRRWEFWNEQFSKCIRCYACRQACPLCYCEECAVDPIEIVLKPDTTAAEKARRPKWLEKSPELSSNLLFHLTRMIHMAGRCTACGECERVCPMKIPLRRLTGKLEKDAKTIFGHESGLSLEGKVMFACCSENDPNCFIR